MVMKAPKHLLNANEVTICKNGVKIYHVKMLNGLIYAAVKPLHRILYFSQSRTVLIKERHYFILSSYLVTIFLSLIKAQVSILVELDELRQKMILCLS